MKVLAALPTKIGTASRWAARRRPLGPSASTSRAVSPGAVIGGGTHVHEHAFIGLGARVRDHIEVCAGAVVGMGAVVVESIAPGVTVVGIPARRHEPSA